jgi:hypothetical protein
MLLRARPDNIEGQTGQNLLVARAYSLLSLSRIAVYRISCYHGRILDETLVIGHRNLSCYAGSLDIPDENAVYLGIRLNERRL